MLRKRGGVMYRHGVWSTATTPNCYGHIYALAFQPLCISMSCATGNTFYGST